MLETNAKAPPPVNRVLPLQYRGLDMPGYTGADGRSVHG